MLVLVFWIESKTTSIIDEKNLDPIKEKGEETEANYKDGKKYRVKIIRKNGDFQIFYLLLL